MHYTKQEGDVDQGAGNQLKGPVQAPCSDDEVMRMGKDILNTLQWSQKLMAGI